MTIHLGVRPAPRQVPHARAATCVLGSTYTATVTAVNRDNRTSSPVKDTATTKTQTSTAPGSPSNLDASAYRTRQIQATWSAPSNSGSSAIKHYTVRYSRSAIGDDPPWRSKLYTTTSTSHTSGDLRRGVTYTVTVTTVNRDNRTSNPAKTRATTKKPHPDAPEIYDLKVHKSVNPFDSADDVTVYWKKVTGASSYKVEWRYSKFKTKRIKVPTYDITTGTANFVDIDAPDIIAPRVKVLGSYYSDTLGKDVKEYRVKNVANNDDDRNYLLEFRVKACINDSCEDSDWSMLQTDRLKDALLNTVNRDSITNRPLCTLINTIETGNTAWSVFLALWTFRTTGVKWGIAKLAPAFNSQFEGSCAVGNKHDRRLLQQNRRQLSRYDRRFRKTG